MQVRESNLPNVVTASGLVLLLAGMGCTRVLVTGELGGEPLLVGGTAVAWLDETSYVQDGNDRAPVLKDRTTDETVLFLQFFQASFDPSTDFAALPAGERQRIRDDIARGDQLKVQVRRGSVLRDGDEVKLVDDVGALPPEILPYLASVDVSFGAAPMGDTARYPERAPVLGGDRSATLLVDSTSPELAGKLTLKVKKTDDESQDFVEGKITVTFAVELLSERLAECNFSPGGAGAVDPCTLNPISPSGGAAAGGPGGAER